MASNSEARAEVDAPKLSSAASAEVRRILDAAARRLLDEGSDREALDATVRRHGYLPERRVPGVVGDPDGPDTGCETFARILSRRYPGVLWHVERVEYCPPVEEETTDA